jgi:hypothetical protein
MKQILLIPVMTAVMVCLSLACGGGGGGGSTATSTTPAITSFVANPTTIISGGTATLTGVFTNGAGVITPGDITAASGTGVTVTPTATTTYTLTVTDALGTFATQTAVVSVGSATGNPAITTQPGNQTVTAGATAAFTVVATGTPAPTYQWYQGTTAIATGGTSATYTTPVTTTAMNGETFHVVVSNSAGSVTSLTVTLTVNSAPASGPTVYVGGTDNQNACYWTIAPGGSPVMTTLGTSEVAAQVFSLVVNDGTVYAGGWLDFIHGPEAGYWSAATGGAAPIQSQLTANGDVNGITWANGNVYCAGEDSGAGGACYWTGTTETLLPKSSSATAIFVDSTGTIFTCGTDVNGNACLWNGTTKTQLSSSGNAFSVFVEGGIAYVAGNDGTPTACYWTVSGFPKGVASKTLLGAKGSSSNVNPYQAKGIYVAGGTVYCAGIDINAAACYWTNPVTGGTPSEVVLTKVPSTSQQSYASSIAVDNGIIYISGFDAMVPYMGATKTSLCFWTVNGSTPVETLLSSSGGMGAANSIFVTP